jgi:hypothetical protein
MPTNEPLRLGQILLRSFRKSRDRTRFNETVRRAIAGKSRDEARDILIEHLRSAGEEILGEPLLEMRLDLLLAPDTPAEKVKLHIDGIASLARASGRLKGLFTDADSSSIGNRLGNIVIQPDWSHTQRILLDDGAQDWIGDVDVAGLVDFRNVSNVSALLQANGERQNNGRIVILIDGRRAGVLDDVDSGPFWDLRASGPDPSANRVSTIALRTKDSGGLWRLDIGGPKSVRHLPVDLHPHD